ncbi:hypothetical protein BJ322DRAFT_1222136 [Thelephora terrestris]|uniref:Uncharacterized protein n=1 Tax=Thelephora terrestris TaxID=56493 RepID=A0A9P6H290_9AGAM|nr:hypothetical protein BJ322DRAFT_1222136 [Thelephora terrestris]
MSPRELRARARGQYRSEKTTALLQVTLRGGFHLASHPPIAQPSIPPRTNPRSNLRQMGSGNFAPVFERWGKEYGSFKGKSFLTSSALTLGCSREWIVTFVQAWEPHYATTYPYLRNISSLSTICSPNGIRKKYWPKWMPFSFHQRNAGCAKTLVEKILFCPLDWVQQRIVPSYPLRIHCLRDSLVSQADKAANQSLAHGILAAVQDNWEVSGETLAYEDVKHICGALNGGTVVQALP